MKCLTIWEPWATLIVCGHKDVENRSWPPSYRGPLLIHAGRTVQQELMVGATSCLIDGKVWNIPPIRPGCIIGVAELYACRFRGAVETKNDFSPWHERLCHGLYLRNARRFNRPIQWRGQQGIFDVPDSAVPEALAA